MTWLPARYRASIVRETRYVWRRLLRPSTVELDGIVVDLCRPEISAGVRRGIYSGAYEGPERRVIAETLRPDDAVLEIGAGLGLVSSICAKTVGGENVTSVEANPRLESLIRHTYQINEVNPTLVLACVAPQAGSVDFFIEDQLVSSSTIQRTETSSRVSVDSLTLDSLIRTVRPTYLIVDVEGAEETLFDGADLSGIRRICLEVHPHVIGDGACTRVIAQIARNGFDLELDRSSGRVLSFRSNGG